MQHLVNGVNSSVNAYVSPDEFIDCGETVFDDHVIATALDKRFNFADTQRKDEEGLDSFYWLLGTLGNGEKRLAGFGIIDVQSKEDTLPYLDFLSENLSWGRDEIETALRAIGDYAEQNCRVS